MKILYVVCVVILFGFAATLAVADVRVQTIEDDTDRRPLVSTLRPLDLPSGGRGGDDIDEDPPEVVSFYGLEYEADAFFWCLDRSGSMEGEALTTLKQEMAQAIGQLSSRSEFSVTRFNTSVSSWSPIPRLATLPNKSAAVFWVNGIEAEGTTCIAPAMAHTLAICSQSRRDNRRVILVGDGVPECPPPSSSEQNSMTRSHIRAANYLNVPIDTIFISESVDGIELFRAIALDNRGTFMHVQ